MSYKQYEPPKAAVDDIPIDKDSAIQLERIASAQKWVINAIVVYLAAGILRVALHPLLVLLAIPAFIAGIIGVLRLSAALDHSILIRVLLVILLFVPLINLLALLRMNALATKRLRAGGYKVGMLGARKA